MHWQSQWHTISVFLDSATQPAILRKSEISNLKSQIDRAVPAFGGVALVGSISGRSLNVCHWLCQCFPEL